MVKSQPKAGRNARVAVWVVLGPGSPSGFFGGFREVQASLNRRNVP